VQYFHPIAMKRHTPLLSILLFFLAMCFSGPAFLGTNAAFQIATVELLDNTTWLGICYQSYAYYLNSSNAQIWECIPGNYAVPSYNLSISYTANGTKDLYEVYTIDAGVLDLDNTTFNVAAWAEDEILTPKETGEWLDPTNMCFHLIVDIQSKRLYEYGSYLVPSQDGDETCPTPFSPGVTVPSCNSQRFTYTCISNLTGGELALGSGSQFRGFVLAILQHLKMIFK